VNAAEPLPAPQVDVLPNRFKQSPMPTPPVAALFDAVDEVMGNV
jgi:hypothetical protein